MQSLQDIDEVNMFKDDNTVIHLKRPQSKFSILKLFATIFNLPSTLINLIFVIAQFSVRENLLVVAGTPETKNLKDMMPDILKQVGPQQYSFLKEALGNMGKGGAAPADDDDDDVPELVGTFEDAQKK